MYIESNLQHELNNIYIYIFGLELRASRLEGDIYGSPQGSPQHRGDELDKELHAYSELFFKGSDELGEE